MLLPEICGHQAASPSKGSPRWSFFIYSCYRKENGPWSCKDPSESKGHHGVLEASRFICKLDSVDTIWLQSLTRAATSELDDRSPGNLWQMAKSGYCLGLRYF